MKKHVTKEDGVNTLRKMFNIQDTPKEANIPQPDPKDDSNNCSSCPNDDVCDAVKKRLKNIAKEAFSEEEIKKAEENIQNNVVKSAKTQFNRKIKETIQDINSSIDEKILNATRKVSVVEVNNEEVSLKEDIIVHNVFDKVLTYVKNDIPVYLLGPTGSGKTHLASQIASVSNLAYYHIGRVTDEYQLTGYMDGNGRYVSTAFFEAFTKGGLFLFDEIDASAPEALITVNTALSNNTMSFPNGIFEKNENFRVIAGGNTISGADYNYTGRSKIDISTLNRFTIVRMDYDSNMERYIVDNDTAILFNSLRSFSRGQKSIDVDFTTRSAIYFDKMKHTNIPLSDLIEEILIPTCDLGDFEDFGLGIDNSLVQKVAETINTMRSSRF